jgi:hypothetical protein
MTMTELTIFEALDFEPTIPCNAGRCNNEAKWKLGIVCGHPKFTFFCTVCKDRMLDYPELICRECHHVSRPGRLAYISVEPI